MNWAESKDPVSYMCLVGAMIASLFLTQEVAGLSTSTVMTNILSLNSANSVKTFRKNSIVKVGLFRKPRYRSGMVNSNTVNSKFHLIRSICEIFARLLSFHV